MRFFETSNLSVYQDPSQSWEYRARPKKPGNPSHLLNGCMRCQLDPLKNKNEKQT